jgi:hypothetical protein
LILCCRCDVDWRGNCHPLKLGAFLLNVGRSCDFLYRLNTHLLKLVDLLLNKNRFVDGDERENDHPLKFGALLLVLVLVLLMKNLLIELLKML